MAIHALFPISVSNRAFSTENVIGALSKLPDSIAKITFFIADWLQLYNRASDCTDSLTLSMIIRDYNKRNKDKENRYKWVSNLLASHKDALKAHYEISVMEDYFDIAYANTLRNVNILMSTDSGFRRDIRNAAELFILKKHEQPSEILVSLSEKYILEEIAVNIRIRIKETMEEEYYLGKYHTPILKLYGNLYSANASDLFGCEALRVSDYKFYELDTTKSGTWSEVSYNYSNQTT